MHPDKMPTISAFFGHKLRRWLGNLTCRIQENIDLNSYSTYKDYGNENEKLDLARNVGEILIQYSVLLC